MFYNVKVVHPLHLLSSCLCLLLNLFHHSLRLSLAYTKTDSPNYRDSHTVSAGESSGLEVQSDALNSLKIVLAGTVEEVKKSFARVKGV